MKVFVVRDSVFTLRNGVPSSDLITYDGFSKRYLASFSEMVLVGRLFDREESSAAPAVGPGVSFLALPGYHGPVGFAKSLPAILRTIWSSLDRDAAYILRVPSTVPSLYALLLRIRGIPFAVEVAADPQDGFSKAALGGHVLAPLFRTLFVRLTRWQSRTAIASAYVTAHALQRRYPPRSKRSEFSFTSIDLTDDVFARAPRAADSFDAVLPHLMMIGNMQKSLKGHDTLLHAMKRLRDEGLRVRLTVIGYGENRALYERMAADLGLGDDVVFTGKMRNDLVRTLLDTADLFVLPSRQEGLPRALLEAMARGLPAIASRVGGTPELVDETSLIEPDDVAGLAARIRRFVTDPALLAEQSRRNLAVARGYHVDAVSRSRRAFYDYVIAALRGAGGRAR